MALTLHEQRPSLELLRFQPAIEDGMANLEQRGQHQERPPPLADHITKSLN